MQPSNLKLGTAVIYIPPGTCGEGTVGTEVYVHEYTHWHLILQPPKNRQTRGDACGLLIAKRPVIFVADLTPEEWVDLGAAVKSAPQKLCDKTNSTYTGHYTMAVNNGELSGQTQAQVHFHIYPVIAEDLPAPGARNGIGAMVETLREKQGR